MNKRLFIVIVAIAIIAGVALGYVRGLPDDVQNEQPTSIDFGYRCGDGTEFTLSPAPLLVTLHLVPASNVDYVREQDLTRQSEFVFTSDDTVLVRTGDTLALAVHGHATTTCTAMFPIDRSFF
jgi:hypothetical protein